MLSIGKLGIGQEHYYLDKVAEGAEAVIRIATSPKGDRFTTQRIWDLEQRALAAAAQMQARVGDSVDPVIASRTVTLS